MELVKVTEKKYSIVFYGEKVWKMTHKNFLNSRKFYGMTTKEFEKCFICEKTIDLDEVPIFIKVKGVGNRFACRKCAEKNSKNATK
ncbi:MAG: hypothetical protein GT601_05855 [Acidaminobacter sp.]|uniref:hypothetical protein n=1 Tax=Acidaminobacter sp. TaxID=1872102 RepID=UPI001382A02C|nr:hypothetical protein [Acidaminobacter sp.]MZQ97180.1 hypothetical protein [Acidaminobacter sp.]